MATDFTIKQHDQLPELTVILTDSKSAIVNVTGASVRFIMTNKSTGVKSIDQPATIVDPTNGVVKYTWANGDTDTSGSFSGEFEVKFPDTRVETFPNSKNINIKVFPDLGGVGI